MTNTLLVSTRPVFLVEGELHGELAEDLLRLEVEEDTSGMKKLQARFIAQGPLPGSTAEGLLYLDGQVFDFGKSLNVSIGSTAEERTIFQGKVTAIEVNFDEGIPPEVVIFAEDQLMDLRMTRRMKTYENVSDADIARAIASEHGLTAEVDAQGPTYKVVQQWNMSDLAFLRQRAALLQAEIWLVERKLFFQTRDKRSARSATLVQGNTLMSAEARADLSHQRTKVVVSGYDASGRESVSEETEASVVEAEIDGGVTGGKVLERAFGQRVSYRVRQGPLVSSEATAWARAEMLRRARSFVTVRGVTSGTPDMVVGSHLTLERMGRPFEGSGYYATYVCHTYDNTNGHRTRFIAERATIQEGT
jgi:phage protein D